MDSDHHFSTLNVWDAHDRVQHDGISETLTKLRDRYWIVRGRSFMKGVRGVTQKYERGVSKCESEILLINIHDIHTSIYGLHRTLVEY